MNHDYGGNRRLLTAGLLPAVAAVAVLATACGGSPSASPVTGESAYYEKALSYSECMRAHGVPDFPDPDAQGNIVQHVSGSVPADDSGPVFQAADTTCRPLFGSGQTNGGPKFRQLLQEDLKLAQCMRAHGVPNFPDPQVPSPASIAWSFDGTHIDSDSPQFKAAERACESLNNSSAFPGA